MKICVVGSGYVGLVTGACLADFGIRVTGVDKDAGKVAALGRGEIPIYEPGLASLVRKNMEAGRLLGYSPKVPIREGLRRFVAWYVAAGAGRGSASSPPQGPRTPHTERAERTR